MTANSADEMNVLLQQPGSIKNETFCPFGGKCLRLHAANVTLPTWQTGRKRSRVSSSNQTINHNKTQEGSDHYTHKSNISKAVNHSESPQLTESHPTHQLNILVSVFLFKCKLSNRFLTGTGPLAISLIKYFIYKRTAIACATNQVVWPGQTKTNKQCWNGAGIVYYQNAVTILWINSFIFVIFTKTLKRTRNLIYLNFCKLRFVVFWICFGVYVCACRCVCLCLG